MGERNCNEVGLYETTVRVGVTGVEEFQFLRDGDWTQVIYPAVPKAMKTSIPVRGPDNKGDGKLWLLRGPIGEQVVIQLLVSEQHIVVTVSSPTKGKKTWRGADNDDWHDYFVVGSWTDWNLSPMKLIPGMRNGYKCRLTLGEEGV